MTEAEIRAVVAETISQLREASLLGGRIGFTEAEAAANLGIPRHRLRDARLRGEVDATKVGKSYVYAAESLRRLLKS